MLDRRAKSIAGLEALICSGDTDVPSALDEKDREAIHITLRIALESDTTFRALLRRKDPLAPTAQTDYLCGTIRSGIDFFSVVMQTAVGIRGVVVPRRSGSLRQLMVEHGKYLRLLEQPKLSLGPRLSLLVALIRVELMFFGYSWPLHGGYYSRPMGNLRRARS